MPHPVWQNYFFQVDTNYDVIVIGGGVSGLSTAATLSKAGKKVLVLEQNFILGGGASTFNVNGVDSEIGDGFFKHASFVSHHVSAK